MNTWIVFKVRKFILIAVLVFGTIGCDQATKLVAQETLPVTGSISFLDNTIRLEFAENTGAFLSFGAAFSPEVRFFIFIGLVAVFLTVLLIQLFRTHISAGSLIAWSFILGGGIGNLIDRIYRGSVIDFLNLGFGEIRTGIFNIADVAIVVGVLFILLDSFSSLRKTT